MNQAMQEFLGLSLKDSYKGGTVIRIEGGYYDEIYRRVVVAYSGTLSSQRIFIFNVFHEKVVEV